MRSGQRGRREEGGEDRSLGCCCKEVKYLVVLQFAKSRLFQNAIKIPRSCSGSCSSDQHRVNASETRKKHKIAGGGGELLGYSCRQ